MANPLPRAERLTYAEYLALEEHAQERHIYWDGELFSMSGGTPEHAALQANAIALLHAALRGRPCRVYGPDLRLRSLSGGDRSVYPDLSVVCGALIPHPDDPNAASNPTLVLEVLSDSTESFDRGRKFTYYRSFPGLRHYVLVQQGARILEVYTRRDAERWELQAFGPGREASLPELGVGVDVDALYDGI